MDQQGKRVFKAIDHEFGLLLPAANALEGDWDQVDEQLERIAKASPFKTVLPFGVVNEAFGAFTFMKKDLKTRKLTNEVISLQYGVISDTINWFVYDSAKKFRRGIVRDFRKEVVELAQKGLLEDAVAWALSHPARYAIKVVKTMDRFGKLEDTGNWYVVLNDVTLLDSKTKNAVKTTTDDGKPKIFVRPPTKKLVDREPEKPAEPKAPRTPRKRPAIAIAAPEEVAEAHAADDLLAAERSEETSSEPAAAVSGA